ncbi:hypothetical protein [Catalinimonas alkaloidigena]|uniref:hypothetical protein n=1 Tax=Catalinimonas alkaloidigena TaxID=1075417 RepID=UPI00240715C4|nr:hypothetical protein [Catalinimonas alkaloidigena]
MLLSFSGKETVRREKAFDVYTQDSIRMEVELVYNADNLPDHYFSHVRTPVCEDGLCDLLVIDLYWDLLGNFRKYETVSGRPLTKFDHEAFKEEDHEKLQKILTDSRSLLGENQLEDLIDEGTKKVSEEVDAVTGATKKSVENAVVSGAVYSTYVLWHIVHGEIAERIPKHTQSIWNENILEHFLTADNYDYQYHALDQLSPEQYEEYMPEVLRMLDGESIFVALYTLAHLPAQQLKNEKWQIALARCYPDLSYRAQNKLLERLSETKLSGESMEILAGAMDSMNIIQLEAVLGIFLKNKSLLTSESIYKLTALLKQAKSVYADKVYQTLKAMKLKDKKIRKAIKNYENN